MRAIGIDIGTTSICGTVTDVESGCIVKSVTRDSGAFINGTAQWERIQSVDRIMAVAMEILDGFIEDDIAVIGVTGQMHGIVYVDKNGSCVSPLYTWQDGRGDLPYKGTTYAAFLGASTGYGNVTDLYNRENGIRPKEAVSYCTIHDYFVMKLCGNEKPLIHSSDAASFGCYDLSKNTFNYDLCAEVVTDFRIAGFYKGIPVSVAIGDNQASVLSSICDGDILLNYGTGSQVSAVTSSIVCGRNIETRPYFEGKYLAVGAALCGGRAYSLLKDFFSEILSYTGVTDDASVYKMMDEMLKKNISKTLVADTRFAGTRADSSIRGSVTGINTDNFKPQNLVYAVLSGMAMELYDMLTQMKVTYTGIVGSGNGIRKNPALVRICEEMFDGKMKIPVHTEEASVGAAMFGLIACGRLSSVKEAQGLIRYVDR